MQQPAHDLGQELDIGFVESGGPPDQGPQPLCRRGAVSREQSRRIRLFPPSACCEPQGAGEVIVGHDRRLAVGVTGLEHALVVVQLGVRKGSRARLDPGPFDPKPVAVEAQSGVQRDILGVAMLAVAGVARPVLVDGRVTISSSQTSELVLAPSLWWAEIAVPHRNPAGAFLGGQGDRRRCRRRRGQGAHHRPSRQHPRSIPSGRPHTRKEILA